MWQYKDETINRIDGLVHPPVKPLVMPPQPKKEAIKIVYRQSMFPAGILKSEEDVDIYVEKIRTNMKQQLKGCDGIKLS